MFRGGPWQRSSEPATAVGVIPSICCAGSTTSACADVRDVGDSSLDVAQRGHRVAAAVFVCVYVYVCVCVQYGVA
jgi:hypothetical protein